VSSGDLDQYVADLTQHEGCPVDQGGCYPYLDSIGVVTACIGEAFESLAAFQGVPWFSTSGAKASPEEVGAAWGILQAEKARIAQVWQQNATVSPWAAYAARHYAPLTTIRVSQGEAVRRCQAKLTNEVLPSLSAAIGAFATVPLAARRCLVDIAWNAGWSDFVAHWPKLCNAVVDEDWRRAAQEAHTHGDDHTGRGVWRSNMMLSCLGSVTS
jgi:GH24 family phage-related lysozyme (muramidase)